MRPACRNFVTIVTLLLAYLPTVQAAVDDPAALAARLHNAAASSSIDTPGLKPWHLKLAVQLFDAKGKPTEQGTIEEWWVGQEERRITYSLPSYTVTQLHNKDGFFLTKSQTYEPSNLDDLLDQVTHPMPHEDEIDKAKPDLRKQTFGKVPLDCIMLDQPMKGVAYPPLGLFPTFCLDSGKDSLRISTEVGSLAFVRNRVGLFQGRTIPIDLTAESDGIRTMSAHVVELSGVQLSDADFKPGADMEPVASRAASIAGGTMAGYALSQPTPVYPQSAKANHVTGTVVIHAIIARDGRIESLHLVTTPDPDLAIAAIVAVRHWTYKPYILNGVPTEVETTINVKFAMN